MTFLLFCLVLHTLFGVSASEQRVSSPDGRFALIVSDHAGPRELGESFSCPCWLR